MQSFRNLRVWERAHVLTLARFLQLAAGSAGELEYHLLLARDLKLLQTPDISAFPVKPWR
jgi:four helix bundle protein